MALKLIFYQAISNELKGIRVTVMVSSPRSTKTAFQEVVAKGYSKTKQPLIGRVQRK